MSARREKRLRKLEARVAYLEGRVHSVEKRQLDQLEREEMYFGMVMAPQTVIRTDPQPSPRRSLWRRLLDAFMGKDGTDLEFHLCDTCRHPTKEVSGCWDGVDEKTGKLTGGFTFTCKNKFCPTFKNMRAAEQEAKRREAAAAEENQKNGTDPDVFLELRRKCRLTLYQVSQMAGVSSSTVSAWETGREPFPADKYLEICRRMREMIEGKEEDKK